MKGFSSGPAAIMGMGIDGSASKWLTYCIVRLFRDLEFLIRRVAAGHTRELLDLLSRRCNKKKKKRKDHPPLTSIDELGVIR
jgi:hypothetical protein